MELYSGIDLHSNNAVVKVIDENDKIKYQKKLPCQLDIILSALNPYQSALQGIAIESTFNWYWLVDGLQENDYTIHLVNTAAVKQYEGLKHTDDDTDAFWLAHLLRLGILPTGYIYPKEQRAVRDLARKRSQLVQQRTTQILSLQTLHIRNTGVSLSCDAIKKLKMDDIKKQFTDANIVLAMESNLIIYEALKKQIQVLESAIEKQIKLDPRYQHLLSIDGIGKILALTIMLETGDINRFESVGNYASYCRCVGSQKLSNSKKKGKGNTKNGNKYLSWAFVEAANFCIRYNEDAKRYYQKKSAKTKRVVALKALAHKLARASYYVMRDEVPFDSKKLFC